MNREVCAAPPVKVIAASAIPLVRRITDIMLVVGINGDAMMQRLVFEMTLRKDIMNHNFQSIGVLLRKQFNFCFGEVLLLIAPRIFFVLSCQPQLDFIDAKHGVFSREGSPRIPLLQVRKGSDSHLFHNLAASVLKTCEIFFLANLS